ncbi:MAG: phage holin family protein [Steroidobacteraceae bacterium]
MTGFVLRAVIAAFGLWLATLWVEGLRIDSALTLLVTAAVLGIVNAFVRPLVIVLTLPISVVTLGLFLLVVNAAMLALVAAMIPGFTLTGFGSAFWGALVVTLTGWIGSWFIGTRGLDRLSVRR